MDTTFGVVVKVFLSALAGAFVAAFCGGLLASYSLGFWGPMFVDYGRVAAAGAIFGATLSVWGRVQRLSRTPHLPDTFEEFRGLEIVD